MSRSAIEWELYEARRGRRRVRVRVSLPRASRVEGEWEIDARLATRLRAARLWDECVVEMARDAVSAAMERRRRIA